MIINGLTNQVLIKPKAKGGNVFGPKSFAFAKCGEETSPTPQMDWSLAHGLKAAFGLNFLHRICPRFFESARVQSLS